MIPYALTYSHQVESDTGRNRPFIMKTEPATLECLSEDDFLCSCQGEETSGGTPTEAVDAMCYRLMDKHRFDVAQLQRDGSFVTISTRKP